MDPTISPNRDELTTGMTGDFSSPQVESRPGSSGIWIWLIVGLILIVAVGLIIWLVASNNNKGDDNDGNGDDDNNNDGNGDGDGNDNGSGSYYLKNRAAEDLTLTLASVNTPTIDTSFSLLSIRDDEPSQLVDLNLFGDGSQFEIIVVDDDGRQSPIARQQLIGDIPNVVYGGVNSRWSQLDNGMIVDPDREYALTFRQVDERRPIVLEPIPDQATARFQWDFVSAQ